MTKLTLHPHPRTLQAGATVTVSDLLCRLTYLEWPLHVWSPPPEDDGAEEGEAVKGPDGKAEEVDQGPHIAEHEQDGERALKKRKREGLKKTTNLQCCYSNNRVL